MITLTKIGDEYNQQVLEISGLSTDEKPIGTIDGITITNSSVFKEIDTGAEYLYNAETNEWVKNTVSTTSVGGKDGVDGITPLLQKSDSAIQVSYDNGSTYEDLVALSEITGEKGDTGANGKDGTNATITSATATVDANIGTPSVTVSAGGTATARTFAFAFSNLKGEQGDKGDKGDTGAKGDKGDTGTNGTNGQDGKSVTAISLTTDADGKVIGGTVTFSDTTTAQITVTVAEE